MFGIGVSICYTRLMILWALYEVVISVETSHIGRRFSFRLRPNIESLHEMAGLRASDLGDMMDWLVLISGLAGALFSLVVTVGLWPDSLSSVTPSSIVSTGCVTTLVTDVALVRPVVGLGLDGRLSWFPLTSIARYVE